MFSVTEFGLEEYIALYLTSLILLQQKLRNNYYTKGYKVFL